MNRHMEMDKSIYQMLFANPSPRLKPWAMFVFLMFFFPKIETIGK